MSTESLEQLTPIRGSNLESVDFAGSVKIARNDPDAVTGSRYSRRPTPACKRTSRYDDIIAILTKTINSLKKRSEIK